MESNLRSPWVAMPKKLDDAAVAALVAELEERVVPKTLRGKTEWPITVTQLGISARLRLIRGRNRIYFDWYVPEEYAEFFEKRRFLQQVPKPSRPKSASEDPGHNPQLAKEWLQTWLREKILAAEEARDRGGVVRDTSVPNDVPLRDVVKRFRESMRFEVASTKQQKQWALWLDFFTAALGPDFRFHLVSEEVLKRLQTHYQREWTRTYSDGRQEQVEGKAGHNTAAKVVRFFRTMCRWAVSMPDEHGGYLLDTDPFGRIPPEVLRRFEERARERRVVEGASDPFASALMKVLAGTGRSGQALLIFGTQTALGRRPGEVRTLRRTHLLTNEQEIKKGLKAQLCRKTLPGGHIPDDEIDAATQAYAERGWAVRFSEGKQATRHPDSVQYDRVVPLGRHLTAVYQHYMKEHWAPLGLKPDEGFLCPAATDNSRPTGHHVAMKWFRRAREKLEEMPEAPEVPKGSSHTLRHRFRATHRNTEDKLVAFVGGWSIRQQSAMNQHYLPIGWKEVVDFIDKVDESTAKCLEGVVSEAV